MTGREHMKTLYDRIRELEAANESQMMENAMLMDTIKAVRQGAHDWKMRAKAAEARCKELLKEHVRMQDEHQHDMDKMTELLVETNEKLAKQQVAWQEACTENNDMLLEINCLKAHAYDLAFGSALERQGCP